MSMSSTDDVRLALTDHLVFWANRTRVPEFWHTTILQRCLTVRDLEDLRMTTVLLFVRLATCVHSCLRCLPGKTS
jgi:hypothetical protein